MRNKETGEFELVVGDKQLLSGFFIGVLLLAVVFAMGYVLGQNSPRSTKLPGDAAAANPPAAAPDIRPQPASPAPPATNPETKPPEPSGAAQAGAAPPAEPQPQPTTQPARDPSEPAAPAPKAAELVPGTYWQVTAQAKRSSAEAVYQTLKDQGFPVVIRPGPKNLTVVWVGPYTDRDSMARAKKRLEDAGLPVVKRP